MPSWQQQRAVGGRGGARVSTKISEKMTHNFRLQLILLVTSIFNVDIILHNIENFYSF